MSIKISERLSLVLLCHQPRKNSWCVSLSRCLRKFQWPRSGIDWDGRPSDFDGKGVSDGTCGAAASALPYSTVRGFCSAPRCRAAAYKREEAVWREEAGITGSGVVVIFGTVYLIFDCFTI